MVIFWPEDGTLWTWNSFPLHPRLRETFEKILGYLEDRGQPTVTIMRVDRPRKKLLRGHTLEARCTAFDFHVGGLEKAGARELVASLNGRSTRGRDPEGPGSSGVVVQIYKKDKRVYLRIELPPSPQALVSPPEEVTG